MKGYYVDSYYTRKHVTVDKRLRYCPTGKCGVNHTGHATILMSYDTAVLSVEDGKMYCKGTYSNTTRKHISMFLREYYPNISYYDVKALCKFNEDSVFDEEFYIDLFNGTITNGTIKFDLDSVPKKYYK